MRTELRQLRSELLTRPPTQGDARRSYSVEETAQILGKTEYTVREWARLGRINATKRQERRGGAYLWSISPEAIQQYRDFGLLPLEPRRPAS
jgi:hypothetical protein